jgi:hypothetical protein
MKLAATTSRRFKLNERRQLFICAHNETLSVIAMRVHNPDRSPLGIDGGAPSPNSNRTH